MTSSYFERIDDEEFTDYQRQISRISKSSVHYRMIRDPPFVNDIVDFLRTRDEIVIWKDDTVCISRFKYGRPRKYCLSLTVANHRFSLSGQSYSDVAQVASFLCSMESHKARESYVCIFGYGVELDIFTAQQVTSILKNNASSELCLLNFNISSEMSVILASQQHRIKLALAYSSFNDWGFAFVDTLEKRSTSFGHLGLQGYLALDLDAQRRLYQIAAIDSLKLRQPCYFFPLHCHVSSFVSKAKKVLFEMESRGDEWKSIKSIADVPKKYFVEVHEDEYGFLSVFLNAAESMVGMGLVIDETDTLTLQTSRDLIDAVKRNTTLEYLELGYINKLWLPLWKQLMDVFGRHQGLSTLSLHVDPECPREMVADLISMLKKNRKITDVELTENDFEDDELMYQLKKTLRINHFFQGSKTLNQDDELDTAIFAAALMERSGNDTRCTAALLSNNVEMLSRLLESAGANSTDDCSSAALTTHSDLASANFSGGEEESVSVAEEDHARPGKRCRYDSNELEIESIAASVRKATEEVLAKHIDTIQVLVQQNEVLTNEITRFNVETREAHNNTLHQVAGLRTGITRINEGVRQISEEGTAFSQFLEKFTAHNQDSSRETSQDQRLANLTSENASLKECIVELVKSTKQKYGDTETTTRTNELLRSSCTIS